MLLFDKKKIELPNLNLSLTNNNPNNKSENYDLNRVKLAKEKRMVLSKIDHAITASFHE